jgi:hydroxypyruvate isomerase
MPRLAANLSLLYTEHDFLDRFAAAAADGFDAVECQFPYAWPADALAQRLQAAGMQQVLINAAPGDWAAGERGLAALPDGQARFRASLPQAIDYALALGCPRIHVMAGILPGHVAPEEVQRYWHTYRDNLAWAAAQAQAQGLSVCIEPLNPRDNPGYLLQQQAQAHALVQAIGAPNLQVQFDCYHCQITEGDLSTRLREGLASGRVGHIQIAGVPDRQEPDSGELNLPYLMALIDTLGYTGWVGCEYRPRAGTSAGLVGLRPWLRGAGRA